MTYKETLDWMFVQLPMYQEKGKSAFNGKLDAIKSFSQHLGNPEKQFKSIHVAGTNGKGSSSHMLASILQEAGYKVGLYTSPHVKDFRERIRINGKPVGEQFVVDFIDRNRPFLDANELSFFEMTVGMAFNYFANQEVDLAIIEVGLGGRLDSTNIITPEVSLITNIGYDHMDILGHTLAKITREKAGIIKPDVPVVISEYQKETAEIFDSIATTLNAEIVFASETIEEEYETSLLGSYQTKNIKGVIATLNMLNGFEFTADHMKEGLFNVVENTGIMGRWQILREQPRVICDTAHNSEGLELVVQQLMEEKFDCIHLVLGFVEDKNLEALLPLFPKNEYYYFSRPDIRRGLDVEILKDKALKHGLKGSSYGSVQEAYGAALKNASEMDIVFVGGSTFTVAEVL
ncbi:MAG: folylpolyglutamate synthase/dihydrofolate synthase family protein [Bacteroidota bacterium]